MDIIDRIFSFIPDAEFEKDFDDSDPVIYLTDKKTGAEYRLKITA